MVPSALRLNCTELTKSVSSLFLLIVDSIYSIFFKGEGCDSDLEAAQPDEDKLRVKRHALRELLLRFSLLTSRMMGILHNIDDNMNELNCSRFTRL